MEKTVFDLPNWSNASLQTANFWFVESEKRLSATISAYTANKEAAFRLLGILLPIITVSIGYILSANIFQDFARACSAFVFVAFQLVGVICLILMLRTYSIQPIGAMPKLMIHKKDIENDDEKQQYVGIILNVCENIQDKINKNTRTNERCSLLLNLAIIISGIVSPLGFMIVSLFCRA